MSRYRKEWVLGDKDGGFDMSFICLHLRFFLMRDIKFCKEEEGSPQSLIEVLRLFYLFLLLRRRV